MENIKITLFLLVIFGLSGIASTATAGNVVYAFDGTSQNTENGTRTNIYRFLEAFESANPGAETVYVRGPGAALPDSYGRIVINAPGKLTGAGAKKLLEFAYTQLRKQQHKGNTGIIIVGFSRGAALAREFAHLIKERQDPRFYSIRNLGVKTIEHKDGAVPSIKFMGLFDTVYSFGLPGDRIDGKMRHTIASNVELVAHATATTEQRDAFDLWSIHSNSTQYNSDDVGKKYYEKKFDGGHDDIGGAAVDKYLSHEPLKWVLEKAAQAGVSIQIPNVNPFPKTRRSTPIRAGNCGRTIYFPRNNAKPEKMREEYPGCKNLYSCKRLKVIIKNPTTVKMKVIDIDYYNYATNKWKSIPTRNKNVDPGEEKKYTIPFLNGVGEVKTQIRVNYRMHQNKWYNSWSDITQAWSNSKKCFNDSIFTVNLKDRR